MGKTVTSKKRKVKTPEEDQRSDPRLNPSSVPFLKSVSFNQGTEVQVIDISRGGMLLETEVRLRPQAKIHLKLLTTDGLIKVDGTVLRSSISSLNGAPRYQSAIAFDNPFNMLDDLSQDPGIAAVPEAQANLDTPPVQETAQSPENLQSPVVAKAEENSSVLTFVAPDLPDLTLLDEFKRNDW